MKAEVAKAAIGVLETLQANAKKELEHIEKCGQPFTVRNGEDQQFLIDYLRLQIHSLYDLWLTEYQKENKAKENENE